jgi:CheY-like chemotaxis protein
MDVSMPVMDGYEATSEIRKFEYSLNLAIDNQAFILGLTAHQTETYK